MMPRQRRTAGFGTARSVAHQTALRGNLRLEALTQIELVDGEARADRSTLFTPLRLRTPERGTWVQPRSKARGPRGSPLQI
jgi:hypothetical protein